MDRRVWRAKPQGGYVRVYEIVNGRELTPTISVSKRVFGEQLARTLNTAYAAGVADSEAEHTRLAKARIADLLKEMGHDKVSDIVRQAPI